MKSRFTREKILGICFWQKGHGAAFGPEQRGGWGFHADSHTREPFLRSWLLIFWFAFNIALRISSKKGVVSSAFFLSHISVFLGFNLDDFNQRPSNVMIVAKGA